MKKLEEKINNVFDKFKRVIELATKYSPKELAEMILSRDKKIEDQKKEIDLLKSVIEKRNEEIKSLKKALKKERHEKINEVRAAKSKAAYFKDLAIETLRLAEGYERLYIEESLKIEKVKKESKKDSSKKTRKVLDEEIIESLETSSCEVTEGSFEDPKTIKELQMRVNTLKEKKFLIDIRA